jgi:hypothetical protein
MLNRYMESLIIDKNWSMLLQLRVIFIDIFMILPCSLAIYLAIIVSKALVRGFITLKSRFS